MDPQERLARKVAANPQAARTADPHGFYEMNERELVNWLGEGHAQPGSVAFKQAELILSMKQREAKPNPDRLNEAHVNLILLPLGVFSVLWQVTGGSILAGSGGAVVTIALLALRPVRVLLVRLLSRVVG